jgi:type I restriction enzyme R subunit
MMASDTQLRSKKKLIERFIEENLPLVGESENIEDAFDKFWTIEKKKAFQQLSKEENLNFESLVSTVSNYLFTQKEPRTDEVISLMNERPSLKERASSSKRVISKILEFVHTFIEGMG